MSSLSKQANRLVTRVLMLFLCIRKTPCRHPECRCREHEVVDVTPLAWWTMVAFLFLAFAGPALWTCLHSTR